MYLGSSKTGVQLTFRWQPTARGGRAFRPLAVLTVVTVFTLAGAVRTAHSAAATTTRPAAAEQTVVRKTADLHAQWKSRFDEEKFSVLECPPFLIAGNGSPQKLAGYRDQTILKATAALQAQFFKTPPDRPVLILLFESEGPYRRLAKKWFDEEDVPHFGFYRHGDRTMLMNVSTGLGTLVHELAHALIAPDFPDVPDWFNEGLASLYEQSQFGRDGKSIKGLPNWRLPALQREVQNETIRPLAELMADPNFRDPEHVGINYAQARYLMYYLQEQGLLRKYYADYRDNYKQDPTGIETLKRLVKPRSWEQFEQDWQKWVMTLKVGDKR